MKNLLEITSQDHEGMGHQMQPTSRLASHDFYGSAATNAQIQVHRTKGKQRRRATMKNNLSKIGTFNVQGLLSKTKQLLLADDFLKYNMKALLIQETHLQGSGVLDIKSTNGKVVRLYYNGHQSRSIQGVGILVHPNVNCSFTPVSSRIMMLRIYSEGIETCLISAYAPTNDSTTKYPEITSDFYNKLTSTIAIVKSKDALIIGGDFNMMRKQNRDAQ